MEPYFSLSGRFQFVFDSPIIAGVFAAAIFAFICSLGISIGRQLPLLHPGLIPALSLNIGMLSLVHLTGSRGPVLSTIFVTAVQLLACFRAKRSGAILLASGTLLANICFLTLPGFGISRRFEEGLGLADASVTNRLTRWTEALPLLLWRPILVLGLSSAGPAYSQWFQKGQSSYMHLGLSNSWLELGIEIGLMGPVIAIALACLALFVALSGGPEGERVGGRILSSLSEAMAFVVLVFILNAATSSIHQDLYVRIYASAAFGSLALTAMMQSTRRLANWVAISLVVSVSLCSLVYMAALASRDGRGGPRYFSDYAVAIYNPGEGATRKVAVLPDRSILGSLYGSAIRDLIARSGIAGEFIIPCLDKELRDNLFSGCEVLVVFGDAHEHLTQGLLQNVEHVVYVHPGFRIRPEYTSHRAVILEPRWNVNGASSFYRLVETLEVTTLQGGTRGRYLGVGDLQPDWLSRAIASDD